MFQNLFPVNNNIVNGPYVNGTYPFSRGNNTNNTIQKYKQCNTIIW